MYAFRREDTDVVVQVDFETMMGQDVAGYVTLPDGVKARRCPTGDFKQVAGEESVFDSPIGGGREIVSDAMGFGEHQFEDFELDRVKNGFVGVRFERDPDVPEFFRVRCSSRSAWESYVKHRGLVDRNRHSGAAITKDELERAKIQAIRSLEQRQEQYAAAVLV